jgi:hypothetical protein
LRFTNGFTIILELSFPRRRESRLKRLDSGDHPLVPIKAVAELDAHGENPIFSKVPEVLLFQFQFALGLKIAMSVPGGRGSLEFGIIVTLVLPSIIFFSAQP